MRSHVSFFFRFAFLVVMLTTGRAVTAEELSPQASVDLLVKQLSAMRSLNASFTQSVLDARKTVLQEVKGVMWIQRPGLFRWDTEEPFPQQIVSDGDALWIFDKDLEQVTKRKLDKQVGNTPALLLSGDPTRLAESFAISAYRYPESGELRFELAPKAKDALFEVLRVGFSNGALQDMFLRDNLGQTTKIVFAVKSLNSAIDKDIFVFRPPEGVDVIADF